MDADTVRLLEDLPDDLQARGWVFVPRESKIARTSTTLDHIAVYVRPYHAPVDHLGTAITVRSGQVYVATSRTRSPSWEAARQAAIDQMRAIDAPRQLRASRGYLGAAGAELAGDQQEERPGLDPPGRSSWSARHHRRKPGPHTVWRVTDPAAAQAVQ